MERRSSRAAVSRLARRLIAAIVLLAVLVALTFALPIRRWRTGELPAPALPLVPGGPPVEMPTRVWIDTDAACGRARRTDPDDCFAILLLARAPGLTVVGISTVFGNAPLAITDSVTRALTAALPGDVAPPVYRGSARPLDESNAPTEAAHALRRALADGQLTIVALGPLTNLAAALDGAPGLPERVGRIVAVMGRRSGHLFHPAEGAGGGMLFGHGPVFRDFNFAQDPEAAAWLLRSGLPLTLVPYEAARQMSLGGGDLDTIAHATAAGAWVSRRAREWLDYWRRDVGREGFYPFDLVGAAWVVAPSLFDCADVESWVGRDERLWGWLGSPRALMVGLGAERRGDPDVVGRVRYCPDLRPGLKQRVLQALITDVRREPRE